MLWLVLLHCARQGRTLLGSQHLIGRGRRDTDPRSAWVVQGNCITKQIKCHIIWFPLIVAFPVSGSSNVRNIYIYSGRGMVAHTLIPGWSANWVPSHPGLHSETLSPETKQDLKCRYFLCMLSVDFRSFGRGKILKAHTLLESHGLFCYTTKLY